jgi:hypothetical protein
MRGKAAAAAAALGVLSGCQTGPTLDQRLQAWVGRSETDLVTALGVPGGTYETGRLKFLQYTTQQTQILPGDPWWGPRPWTRWGPVMAAPVYVVTACTVTFNLRGGVVEGFSFRGEGCR